MKVFYKQRSVTLSFLLLFFSSTALFAQLTIDECREKARLYSPLHRQEALIQLKKNYELSIANSSYLPKASISGKATYQSETTSLPISLPGIVGMDKDQYQIVAELSQNIWDGGVTSAQKKLIGAGAVLNQSQLESSLYSISANVDAGFFGMLMATEQLVQNQLLQEELNTNYARIQSYVTNGIANRSDLDSLEVERLNARQHRIELLSSRKAAAIFLSALIGITIAEDAVLKKPLFSEEAIQADGSSSFEKRPELTVFVAQETLTETRKAALYAALKPRIGIFLQGGYGKPGLNMFSPDPDNFYIFGARLSWNIDGFLTLQKSLKELETEKLIINSQKDAFLVNLGAQVLRDKNEIEKIRKLIELDSQIIIVRERMKAATQDKLKLGASSVSDLIRDINAENLSRQGKALHEIQLLMAIYELKNTINE